MKTAEQQKNTVTLSRQNKERLQALSRITLIKAEILLNDYLLPDLLADNEMPRGVVEATNYGRKSSAVLAMRNVRRHEKAHGIDRRR